MSTKLTRKGRASVDNIDEIDLVTIGIDVVLLRSRVDAKEIELLSNKPGLLEQFSPSRLLGVLAQLDASTW